MLLQLRQHFQKLVYKNDLLQEDIAVLVDSLSSHEAIGQVNRDDLALQRGEEVLIEATFEGSRGQAFTDTPRGFVGTIGDLFDLDLTDDAERPLFIAALNAVLHHLGVAQKTVHCSDEDLEACGARLAEKLRQQQGPTSVGLVGLQPVILEGLVAEFGPQNVRTVDLNPDNIGTKVAGVEIWDGKTDTERLVREMDVVLSTGSTLANGSMGEIHDLAHKFDKEIYFYGTTVAGAAALLDLKRLCPFARG